MQSSTTGLISSRGSLSELISQRADIVEKEVQMRMRFDHLLPGDVKKLFEAEVMAVLQLAASGVEVEDHDIDG